MSLFIRMRFILRLSTTYTADFKKHGYIYLRGYVDIPAIAMLHWRFSFLPGCALLSPSFHSRPLPPLYFFRGARGFAPGGTPVCTAASA